MAKKPSMQFYVGDWRKDPGVQSMDYEERGVWFEILLLMWESEQRGRLMLNGQPIPTDRLAKLLGLDKQKVNQITTTLVNLGVASVCEDTGALMCRRMVRDEKLTQTRRESGKLGGNPALVNQKDNQNKTTRVKQNPTPSSSSSTSSSKDNRSSKHIDLDSSRGRSIINSDDDDPNNNPMPTPYGRLAAMLRTQGVLVTASHPTLIAWVDEGFHVEQLQAALKKARQYKPAPEQIHPNYLDKVLRNPTTSTGKLSIAEQNRRAAEEFLAQSESESDAATG